MGTLHKWSVTALVMMTLMTSSSLVEDAQAQQVRAFTPRYVRSTTGDVRLIGNTVSTCLPSRIPPLLGLVGGRAEECTNANGGRAGGGAFINNDTPEGTNYDLGRVDIDSDNTTITSSASTLALPAGATVLFAGLYWGAGISGPGNNTGDIPNYNLRNTVRVRVPTAGAPYTTVNAATCDASNINGVHYSCFADVTAQVAAAGNGSYTVANVRTATDDNAYGGWGLVVAYELPSEPKRNIAIFDGYAVLSPQGNQPATVSIPVSGFVTPFVGMVNTKLGVLAYEGDLGITGDGLRIAGQDVSNMLNPTANNFNSSITSLGARVTAKNPDYVNQFGFDVDQFNLAGALGNGVTSTTIELRTTQDVYLPAVVSFSTDIYDPLVTATKRVTDVNGGQLVSGDQLEYRFTVSNIGQDPADNVLLTDVVPMGTTFVPGSLQVISGANMGVKTDAAADDQADFSAADRKVTFRLGAGANGAAPGTLDIGASTVVAFRVSVNAGLPQNTSISNQASISYAGRTLGLGFTALSDSDPTAGGDDPTVIVIAGDPPMIAIVSPANMAVLTSTPTLSGTSTPGTTVTIRVDGGMPVTATSDAAGAWLYTPPAALTDGMHSITATATDAAGSSATTPARTFTIDSIAPSLSIVTPAAGAALDDTTPTFTGTAEAGSMLTASVDGQPPVAVTVGAGGMWTFTPAAPLAEGPHTLTAVATDAAGNVATASRDITIDTIDPSVIITAPAANSRVSDSTPTITGTSEPLATLEISINGMVVGNATADAAGAWSFTPADEIADGQVTLLVTAADAAGNSANATRTFTVDTSVAPLVISSPAPGAALADNTPTITGTSSPGATISVMVDGMSAGTVTANAQGAWSFTPAAALGDGQHTIVVATGAGNMAVQAAVTFAVDTIAPALSLTSPTDGSIIGDTRPTISGRGEPGTPVALIIDGMAAGTVTPDAQGDWTFTPGSALNTGAHTISATSTDAAGNASTVMASFTVDPSVPTLTVDAPTNGAVLADSTPLISGTADPGASILIIVDNAEAITVSADANGAWSATPMTALADGAHDIVVSSTSANGKTARVEVDFTVDTMAGMVAITSPANNAAINSAQPAITGTGEAGAVVTVVIDGAPAGTVTIGQDGSWTFTPPIPLAEGMHTITANATDAAGNTGSASVSVTVDTTPPVLVVTSPADGDMTGDQPVFTGTGEPGSMISIVIDGAPAGTVTVGADGMWTFVPNAPLADGPHTVTVAAIDGAGNRAELVINFTSDMTMANPDMGMGGDMGGDMGMGDMGMGGDMGNNGDMGGDDDMGGAGDMGQDGDMGMGGDMGADMGGSNASDGYVLAGGACSSVPGAGPGVGAAFWLALALAGVARRRRRA